MQSCLGSISDIELSIYSCSQFVMVAFSSGDKWSPSGRASKAFMKSKASEAGSAKPAPVLTRLVGHPSRIHCDRVAEDQRQWSDVVPMETKMVTSVDSLSLTMQMVKGALPWQMLMATAWEDCPYLNLFDCCIVARCIVPSCIVVRCIVALWRGALCEGHCSKLHS